MSEIRQPEKPAIRRFASNLISILASDILNKGTTFLIYILVARQLGTFAFGQMSLALTLFYSFQVIAAFGLPTLITREIAKDKSHSGKYFISSMLVAIVTSVGSVVLLTGAVLLLDYPVATRDLILISGLGLLPFAIGTVCEAVIRGWEKMHLIAFVQVPVNLLKVGVTAILVFSGGDIFHVILVIVAARFLISFLLLAITIRQIKDWPSDFRDTRFAKSLARNATTFVGIDTVTAWWTSLNIVLLSKLTTETEVGLYNSAGQLLIPLGIFYQSVMLAAFPIMCRKFSTGRDGLRQVSSRLIELLLAMAIPGTIGLFILAEPALQLVYGETGFVEATGVLRITVFILIFNAFTFALGHILLAGSRELTTLRIVTVDLIVGLVLGLILISNFGLIGAAVAALLTRIVDLVQHYNPVREIISHIHIGHVIWKPILASLFMAVYLLLIRDQNLFFCIASGALLYIVTYVCIEAVSMGGLRNFSEYYLGYASGKRS